MFKFKEVDVFVSEIAELLNLELIGNDFIVKEPSTVSNIKNDSFIYFDQHKNDVKALLEYNNILLITSKKLELENDSISQIISNQSEADFVKILDEFYVEYEVAKIADSAKINPKASIGNNVSIGENVVIGPDVEIGNNTKILNNIVITGRVEIGKDCIIKDNSTIGSHGFDFVMEEGENPSLCPHIGKIIIGDHVWIGSNTSIESGSLDDTIIKNHVKIDDLVQIGYNSIIGESSMITAGVIISRSVVMGRNCWISANATIRDNIKIADNVTIGVGAVVVKDKDAGSIYVGNPAKLLKIK